MVFFNKQKIVFPYTNIKTEAKELESAPIPSYVRIPLLSAKNKIGVPNVKKGDKVLEGDVIGQANSFLFYSSISGVVKSINIEEMRLTNTLVLKVPIIEIVFTGKIKNWTLKKYDYLNRSADELKSEIIRMGVENLEPTSELSIEDILNFESGAHLIVSALESAPMVSFGKELLIQFQEEVHTALSILEYIIQPSKTTIIAPSSLKNKYTHTKNTVEFTEAAFPQGHEKMLFSYFTGIKNGNKNILKEKKYVFIDTQTLYHIYNAIILKKPFIEQLITIDGKVSKFAAHYFVRLGANIQELIQNVGFYDPPNKVVSRNILNADIIYNLELCINPYIYSLFLLDEEKQVYKRFDDCIQCDLCYEYCPVDISPYKLIQYPTMENSIQEMNKCIDCGICSYICPARIPLGYFIDLAKEEHNES